MYGNDLWQMMKGRSTMKPMHLLAVLLCVVLVATGLVFHLVQASAGERNLTTRELTMTRGRTCLDCDNIQGAYCDQPGCPSAKDGMSYGMIVCPGTVTEGNGAFYVPGCQVVTAATGTCVPDTEYPETVCYRYIVCGDDGSPVRNAAIRYGECHYDPNVSTACLACKSLANGTEGWVSEANWWCDD